MERRIINSKLLTTGWFSLGFLVVGVIGSILYSPKWHNQVFAWIGPFCLLYFFRLCKLKGKFLWFALATIFIYLASAYDVAPLPFTVLAVLGILSGIHTMIIFLVDRWLTNRTGHFLSTLFFPSACVFLEFLNIKIAGGSWWSLANTQYPFKWLIQLASITGLAGISFLIYWFASIAVWSIKRIFNNQKWLAGLVIYMGVFFISLSFGAIRYYSTGSGDHQYVKVAGISVSAFDLKQQLYKDYYGKAVIIDPKTSVTSPLLQDINKAWFHFIESRDSIMFSNSFQIIQKTNDSLFILSQKAAELGARIVCWSEAGNIVFKDDEPALVERGKAIAIKNKIYLLMAIASIEPGKISPGKYFIENKTVFIDPSGKILNIFYKNKPVPSIERSRPGDGNIPSIPTAYGNISPSICYDADFPVEMRQLGNKKTALLLLPGRDWFAISPYHTYMAVFRGIENGCSVMRQVSGGLSLATDYRGRSYGSMENINKGMRLWSVDIPIEHIPTVYSKIGDAFILFCEAIVAITIIYLLLHLIRGKINIKN